MINTLALEFPLNDHHIGYILVRSFDQYFTYQHVQPPSTVKFAPDINDDAVDDKKITGPTSSDGFPNLPIGTFFTISLIKPGDFFCAISDGNGPGDIQLILIFSFANSHAAYLVH